LKENRVWPKGHGERQSWSAVRSTPIRCGLDSVIAEACGRVKGAIPTPDQTSPAETTSFKPQFDSFTCVIWIRYHQVKW
jgi:hypothetical protein